MSPYPENKLVPSLASESLADALVVVADASLDTAITSGALNDIPVVGIVAGLAKATRDIGNAFLLRKVVAFLGSVSSLTPEQRQEFNRKFNSDEEREKFGGALMVLIDRAEDIEKPKIMGRLLAGHVLGAFTHDELMRMCKMVDRSYFEDFVLLQTLKPGLQHGREVCAQSLTAAGFMHQIGFDGGEIGVHNGGIMYGISQYGEWLVTYGLQG